MPEPTCDKGPILNELLESVALLNQLPESVRELKTDQKRMIDALVDIAKHQEKLVALADRTSDNKKDIDVIYKMTRDLEEAFHEACNDINTRVTNHLLNHPNAESCKINKALTVGPDGKFDKVQIAVIVSLIFFLSSQAYAVLKSLLDTVQKIGG